MASVCSSCKKEVVNLRGTTAFSCPGCGKVEFTRCQNCRANAVRYTCQECGFSGPN
ncbi:MAG TPA: zinc finger domain-containing protein [Candidatus Nanoarchaeia archaeon]|nr:zinc finger domain-containing protein [Candidatus Nanoarchaeia archaeon]